jgi:phage shock protein PspC (stress-responsive transcriptional regulator)
MAIIQFIAVLVLCLTVWSCYVLIWMIMQGALDENEDQNLKTIVGFSNHSVLC